MSTLTQLHADIETRVRAIQEDYPDWLCRLGCDGCCQWLAEVPRLTAAEWDWLRYGLAALPSERLRKIGQYIAALAEQSSRPIVCPLLDLSAGACLSTPTARWLAAPTGSMSSVIMGFTVMTSSRAWPVALGPGWCGAIRTP